jgi:hypothetical protein
MSHIGQINTANGGNKEEPFLRKQAWDYFAAHASQRMTIFNFYIALSSLTASGYFLSFKSESNLQSVRWVIALSLCFFAFVFWKLDERNKALIKNAENALRHFEKADPCDPMTKVFTQEKEETDARRRRIRGLGRLMFWRLHLSYSVCFNLVYGAFFVLGFWGFARSICCHVQWVQWAATIKRVFGCG